MAFTAEQLALHVGRALERDAGVVLAYWWPQPWTGTGQLEIGDANVPVEHCESVLDVRERLARHSDSSRVLLVAVPETELGQDVLARIYGRRLLHIDRWEMVEEAFGTRQIDPRLYNLPWVADALLDLPAKPLGNGVTALTYEDAIGICIAPIFGSSDFRLELDELLTGCEHAAGPWNALPAERKEIYEDFLRERFGPIASALIGAMTAGHGHAVVSIGLACEVLYGEHLGGVAELRDSRVRLETFLGGHRISESDGRLWAQASERLLRSRPEAEWQAIFQGTSDLLGTLGAGAYLAESGLLPQAFDSRLDALGKSVLECLKKPDRLPDVEQTAAWVSAHRLVPADHSDRRAAQMALALCRREASASGSAPANLVMDYLKHGAWEDYARRVLRSVRREVLARAVATLLARVAERRAPADRKFAEQLAEDSSASAFPANIVPIENALDQLVAPLARQMPMAIVVLDGMSWDVYLGIAESLERLGWENRRFEQGPASLLATVPSTTECSRTSLLCGRLMRGTSATEKAAFIAHPALVRASRAGNRPMLLHKAELVSGNQLSEEAARALANPEQQVVGLVLNAVDDALSKSDQVRIDWSAEAIPLLGAVLTQARLAGRAVLLTSDHGHVLERESKYRAASGTERWRTDETPSAEGEIRVTGSRVRALLNADVIVPWREDIRYGTKKNGYHGGVSRQEMLVPLGLWLPSSSVAPAYPVNLLRPPEWWEGPLASTLPAPTAVAPAGRELPQHDLFAAPPDESWITALLSSALMSRQRARVGRMALDEKRLTRLLQCLDQRGGRATTQQLAEAVEQPVLRMRGMVSAMQRMLNVDGYPVVSMEAATGTVLINRDLLRKQFDL